MDTIKKLVKRMNSKYNLKIPVGTAEKTILELMELLEKQDWQIRIHKDIVEFVFEQMFQERIKQRNNIYSETI